MIKAFLKNLVEGLDEQAEMYEEITYIAAFCWSVIAAFAAITKVILWLMDKSVTKED